MHRTIGESNGTTQLAMPPEDTSQFMNEKEKNYQLETCESVHACLLATAARLHRLCTVVPVWARRVENHC